MGLRVQRRKEDDWEDRISKERPERETLFTRRCIPAPGDQGGGDAPRCRHEDHQPDGLEPDTQRPRPDQLGIADPKRFGAGPGKEEGPAPQSRAVSASATAIAAQSPGPGP
jgi:hypothetical protein